MDAPIIAPIIKVSILTPCLRMLAYAGKQKKPLNGFLSTPSLKKTDGSALVLFRWQVTPI